MQNVFLTHGSIRLLTNPTSKLTPSFHISACDDVGSHAIMSHTVTTTGSDFHQKRHEDSYKPGCQRMESQYFGEPLPSTCMLEGRIIYSPT